MNSEFRRYINILEAHDKAFRVDLPYNRGDLAPVMSKATLDLHYGKLHKNYVDKALDGLDYEWNIAGAELHNLLFAQFRAPHTSNKPTGASLLLLEEKWETYEDFQQAFEDAALGIQGSGWCYLSTNGEIKTIPNHKSTKGIVLIADMWEHAYILDYGSDKKKYIENFWKIVDWNIVNARMDI